MGAEKKKQVKIRIRRGQGSHLPKPFLVSESVVTGRMRMGEGARAEGRPSLVRSIRRAFVCVCGLLVGVRGRVCFLDKYYVSPQPGSVAPAQVLSVPTFMGYHSGVPNEILLSVVAFLENGITILMVGIGMGMTM